MTKIRCGSPMCIHNYNTEDGFCDAEEINLTDIMTTEDGKQQHYHSCKSYEEGEDAKRLREIIEKALKGG